MSKAHNLLPAEIAAKLPVIGHYETADAKTIPVPLKIFDPTGCFTWYATEYNPDDKTFYGFVVGLESELGYFSLEELQTVKGRFGLKMERDLHWDPTNNLLDVIEGRKR